MEKKYKPIDPETKSTHDKMEFINLHMSLLLDGSANAFRLKDFYSLEGFEFSPVFLSRDNNYLKRFYFELLCTVKLTWDEFRFLCSYLVDSKGVTVDAILQINPKDRDVSKNLSIEELLLIYDCMTDFLVDYHLKWINTAERRENVLIEDAYRNPTIANLYYLKRWD